MWRTSRVRALAFTALVAVTGCQDYNFNPVGHCVIQPGTRRVKLSDISTADVLFVVDDSGSMGGEQAKLAANFDSFITNLNATNVNRVLQGLIAIDFHVAITTTSVFDNLPDSTNPSCRDDCPNTASTDPVCCKTLGTTPIGPYQAVQKCAGPADTSCKVGTCQDDCVSFLGEYVCCDASNIPTRTEEVPCTTVGAACGNLTTHYRGSSSPPLCAALSGQPYPQGQFVAAGTNPKVLHFDKSLYTCATPPCTNDHGQQVSDLITFFKQNVMVGTCGSNEEQGLEAARRAVEYWSAQPQPAAPGDRDWLHRDSKLVLVFVGDEDDCSSLEDPSKGIILSGNPGSDTCVLDAALPADEQKLTPVHSFVDYFTSDLDEKPLGSAFIVSARASGQDVCQDETCTPDLCCDNACTIAEGLGPVCTSTTCGGQAKGTRLLEAAGELRANQADVVAGSICDPGFGTILDRIAEIVKPPSGLLLPSQPADEDVTVLRITSNGKTRKNCNGPAPAELSTAEAEAASYDWWFTASREQLDDVQKDPTAASKYIYINHLTDNCEARPGETYSADYIGRLPASGCSGEGATPEEAMAAADDSCVAMLGGRPGDWTCFAGTDAVGACVAPASAVVGTCLCGSREVVCRPPD